MYLWNVNVGNTFYGNIDVSLWIAGYQGTSPSPISIDGSDKNFKIYMSTPSVTPTIIPTPTPHVLNISIVSPNGGEKLYVGTTYPIVWNSSPNIDKVTIGYSSAPGSLNWIANNIPNNGSYMWNINVGNTGTSNYKIYIIGYQTGYGSISDYSDNYFTVQSFVPTIIPTPTLIPTIIPLPTNTSKCGVCPKGMLCPDVCRQSKLN
jgi:hypothetical protein